ncbi:MAG: ABC transporter permease [Lachnospiraceae bacterium]|nr:ABC transporter permease [Lachnospiraceae bacterium]
MRALLAKDIRLLFRGRKLLLLSAALLLFAALAYYAGREPSEQQGQQGETVSIGVVNHDTSVYSKLITSTYLEGGFFTDYVSVYLEDEESVRRRFKSGELDMYLEIPEDFANSMVYLEHLPVEVVISTRNTTIEIMLKNLMESYAKYISAVEINCVSLHDIMLDSGMSREAVSRMNDRISMKLILQALAKNDFFKRVEREKASVVRLVPFFLYEAVFVLTAFLALLCGLLFQREHHAGIVRRLNALGTGTYAVLLEKLLLFSVLFAAGVFLAAGLLSPAGVRVSGQTAAVVCATGCVLASVMLSFSALFQKTQNYLLAGNLFILLGAILGGGIIPYFYLPERMDAVAVWMPNNWYLKRIFRAAAGKLTTADMPSAAAATLACLLLPALAAAVYRRREGRVYENA